MGVHLGTDPASQLKLQPLLTFFSNRSVLICLILFMNHNVTTIIIVITIKVIIVISSEPVRKDTISCILLLQKFRIIISSIIALITYVKESHQFSLAWSELVVCEGFIPRLVIFFEVFTMPPWLEQCQHCSTVVLPISSVTSRQLSSCKIGNQTFGIRDTDLMSLIKWMILQKWKFSLSLL